MWTQMNLLYDREKAKMRKKEQEEELKKQEKDSMDKKK